MLSVQCHSSSRQFQLTLGEFRAQLLEESGLEKERQRLIFRGQVLTDDAKTLEDYGNGRTSFVVLSSLVSLVIFMFALCAVFTVVMPKNWSKNADVMNALCSMPPIRYNLRGFETGLNSQ